MFIRSLLQLLDTDDVSNVLILFTLLMEAIPASETYVFTRATRHHIQEDSILQDIPWLPGIPPGQSSW
jgi:hypothetical protein